MFGLPLLGHGHGGVCQIFSKEVCLHSDSTSQVFSNPQTSNYNYLFFLNENSLLFFELYAFIILTSTLVPGINYFVIITRPLHPIPRGAAKLLSNSLQGFEN